MFDLCTLGGFGRASHVDICASRSLNVNGHQKSHVPHQGGERVILLFIQAALPCEWTDDGVSPCRMWLELTFVQPLQGFCQCIVTFGLEVAVVGFCDGNVRRKAIAHEV